MLTSHSGVLAIGLFETTQKITYAYLVFILRYIYIYIRGIHSKLIRLPLMFVKSDSNSRNPEY